MSARARERPCGRQHIEMAWQGMRAGAGAGSGARCETRSRAQAGVGGGRWALSGPVGLPCRRPDLLCALLLGAGCMCGHVGRQRYCTQHADEPRRLVRRLYTSEARHSVSRYRQRRLETCMLHACTLASALAKPRPRPSGHGDLPGAHRAEGSTACQLSTTTASPVRRWTARRASRRAMRESTWPCAA